MQTLKQLIGMSQVVLGDDYPYGEPLTYVRALKELANDGTLTVPEINAYSSRHLRREQCAVSWLSLEPAHRLRLVEDAIVDGDVVLHQRHGLARSLVVVLVDVQERHLRAGPDIPVVR